MSICAHTCKGENMIHYDFENSLFCGYCGEEECEIKITCYYKNKEKKIFYIIFKLIYLWTFIEYLFD